MVLIFSKRCKLLPLLLGSWVMVGVAIVGVWAGGIGGGSGLGRTAHISNGLKVKHSSLTVLTTSVTRYNTNWLPLWLLLLYFFSAVSTALNKSSSSQSISCEDSWVKLGSSLEQRKSKASNFMI